MATDFQLGTRRLLSARLAGSRLYRADGRSR
jgi:hypothetical protein